MKRCPLCRRDYFDASLSYCLDDGSALVEGPASVAEPQTAIFPAELPGVVSGSKSENITAPSPERITEKVADAGRSKRITPGLILGLVMLVGVVVGIYKYLDRGASDRIRSIAVLPFVNESGTQELEHIAEGLPETLIYRLSQLPDLVVAPRSSAFRFKGNQVDVNAVGNELGTDAVLTGNVAQRGENLIINVELVDVRTKRLVWGDQFDRRVSDLLATQREIAAKVTESLRVKMTGKAEQAVSKQYTTSGEAYQLYLKGRYRWSKRAAPELHAAIQDFQQAIAADPNFALAYTGLADAYSVLPIYDPQAKAITSMPLAKDAVSKALAIDDSLAEAHASRAIILDIFDWNTTEAERAYRRGIEINPSYVPARQWYGEMLCSVGRFDEGLAQGRKSLELEPFYLPANFAYGLNLYKARRYDEALAQLQRLDELSPDYTDVNHFRYQIYAAKGEYQKAVDAFIRQLTKNGEPPQERQELKNAFDVSGWPGFLRTRIKQIESGAVRFHFTDAAGTYALAGDITNALRGLEKSIAQRDEGVTWLLVDPKYDNLRGDPRFEKLVKQAGFAD